MRESRSCLLTRQNETTVGIWLLQVACLLNVTIVGRKLEALFVARLFWNIRHNILFYLFWKCSSTNLDQAGQRKSEGKKKAKSMLSKSGCDEANNSVTQILPFCPLVLYQFFTSAWRLRLKIWGQQSNSGLIYLNFYCSLWCRPKPKQLHMHSAECAAVTWTWIFHFKWSSRTTSPYRCSHSLII